MKNISRFTQKFNTISLKVKLPLLMSLLVAAVLLATSVTIYWVSSDLLVKKAKMKSMPMRTGSVKDSGIR